MLVNGLGATPLEELYIVFRKTFHLLKERGVTIYRHYVGEFATSLEMAGCSVTFLKLDAEAKRLLDAPASSPRCGRASKPPPSHSTAHLRAVLLPTTSVRRLLPPGRRS